MTVTLLTSQSAPTATDADALITGVFQGPDGPVLTLAPVDIDLMAALTALGATGKAEEITKVPTGRLPGGSGGAPPVIVAVGLGPEPEAAGADAERQAHLERLRRAAGAATRDLTAGTPARAKRIAVALPAGEPDEAEAVALGALLGRYAFRKHRAAASAPRDIQPVIHTTHAPAARPATIPPPPL